MGNTENDFCQKSNYICNIFPIQNKDKRKSISLNINNNINNNNNSLSSNDFFVNKMQIENGEHNSSNINVSNSGFFPPMKNKNFSKYFLIKPNSRNSSIQLRNIQKIKNKNFENKNKTINVQRSCTLDIINNQNLSYIMDLKKNFNKNKLNNNSNFNDNNINKDLDKNLQIKYDISTEEEETIINYSLSEDSIPSIQSCPLINNNTNHLMNINNNSEISEIKEIKESEEYSNKDNEIISEKQMELLEIKSEDFPEKDIKKKNNLIKGLKSSNFKFSHKSLIRARFSKHFTINESKKRKIRESNKKLNTKFNQKQSTQSIPEARHFDPEHPLNFLTVKRQIQSSLFPLNKKAFNIIIYKEDNSKQYSYFDNGIANGITKYIISDKMKIYFEGEFENGFPKGYGKYSIISEGKYYEGIWDKEILIGIETWKDGTIYMGNF